MKIGVSSYSFQQYINAGKMTQLDAVEKAKKIGFDAIEFTDLTPHDGSTNKEYAKKIASKAKECGIEITCYAVGANMVCETEKEYKAQIDALKERLDEAAILGVGLFRHDATFDLKSVRSFDMALPQIAKGIREVTEYAQTLGIKTMVENHGFICQDSDRVERLFNAVNHENFGLLVDMGNFTCVDENPATAVSRLARYAFHAHAKDMLMIPFDGKMETYGYFNTRACNKLRGTIIGQGIVPVKQCIAILKSQGYDGTLSLEYEGGDDCIIGIETGFRNLKSYIEELEA